MIFDISRPLYNTLIIYLISSILIYVLKPRPIFRKNGEMKSFGYGNKKTCLSYPIVITLIGIITYFIFVVLSINLK